MPRNPHKTDYSGGMPELLSVFSIIEAPRIGWNKKHHFGEVLFMAVTAMLCGMNTFADIEDFCKLQISWFKKWVHLPSGVPRAQTFSNIFQLIDPKHFNAYLCNHIKKLSPELVRQITAIDGKCLPPR